eukprot:403337909
MNNVSLKQQRMKSKSPKKHSLSSQTKTNTPNNYIPTQQQNEYRGINGQREAGDTQQRIENNGNSFIQNQQRRLENRKQNNAGQVNYQQNLMNPQTNLPENSFNHSAGSSQQKKRQTYQNQDGVAAMGSSGVMAGTMSGLTGGGLSHQFTNNQIPYVSDKEQQSYL